MSTEQDDKAVTEAKVEPITSVHIGYDEGHYDLLSNDRSACIRMVVMIGEERVTIRETWPIDYTPGRDNMREPEEAMTLIEDRLKEYWINIGRDEKLRNIEMFRSRIDEINHVWAAAQIATYEAKIKHLEHYLSDAALEASE